MRAPTVQDAIEGTRPRFATPTVVVPKTAGSLRPWDVGSSAVWLTTPTGPLEPLSIVYESGHCQN